MFKLYKNVTFKRRLLFTGSLPPKDWLHSLSALRRGNPLDFMEDVGSMGLGLWGLWKQSKTATETGFMADEEENWKLGEEIVFERSDGKHVLQT